MTFTLPPDHKWTSVEEALKSAHDQEYELRMAFFWECQRLKAEVERLTKAGDAMHIALNLDDDVFDNHEKDEAQEGWIAAKDGKANA